MSLIDGTYQGYVTPADIGLVGDDNTKGAANVAALNAALGQSVLKPITIDFTSSEWVYFLNGLVTVPTNRTVVFKLNNKYLYQQGDYPTLQFKNFDNSTWAISRVQLHDGQLQTLSPNHAVLETNTISDLTDTDMRFGYLLIRDCYFWSAGGSKMAIDFITNYSGTVRVEGCNFDSSVRWRPRGEYHTCSNGKFRDNHTQIASGNKCPGYYIEAFRNLQMSGNVVEGIGTWDVGVDPDDFDNCIGTYIRNPGFAGGHVFDQWHEFWEIDHETTCEMLIDHYLPGSAAAADSRYFHIRNFIGQRLRLKNTNNSTAPFYVRIDGTSNPPEVEGMVRAETYGYNAGQLSPADNGNFADNAGVEEVFGGENTEMSLYKRSPFPLYEYKGGTGNYGATTKRTTPFWPHYHPTYGHCLITQVNASDGLFDISSFKMLDDNEYFFMEMLASSPNLSILNGGTGNNLRLEMQPIGEKTTQRVFPNGYQPVRIKGVVQVPEINSTVFKILDFWIDEVYHPSGVNPYIAIYGLTISKNGHIPVDFCINPCQSREWLPGNGPPAGTYTLGDTVYGSDRHYICTRPGTSRTISVTGNTVAGSPTISGVSNAGGIFVGDWLIDHNGGEFKVIGVPSLTSLTMDRNATKTRTATSLTNYIPQWKNL